MAHSTTAAWGIPVDAQEIGHKVQAYVDTEIIMQAFRLCVNHSSNGGTSLPAVPEEILRMIADYVKGATMRPHSTEWEANISGCLSEFPLEALFSEEEMMETCKELGCDYTTDDGHRDLRNELMNSDEGHVRSEKRLMRFLVYIGLAGNTRECAFAKYNKVIAKDFGLQVYFTKHETEGQDMITVLAHLIKPSRHTTSFVDMRLEQFSYTSTLFIDLEDLLPGSVNLGPQFERAMKKLELKPSVHPIQCAASFPTNALLPESTSTPFSSHCMYDWKGTETRREELELSKWPKLVVLVNGAELSDWNN